MTDVPDIVRIKAVLEAGNMIGIEPVAGETLSEFSDRVLQTTAQQRKSISGLLVLRIALAALTATTGIVFF